MLQSVYPLKLFIKKPAIFLPLLVGLVLNGISWLWMWWGVTPRSEQAVLHYTVLFQVDQLGSFGALYQVPAIGLGILLINVCVSWALYNYDVFLAELTMFAGALLQIGIIAAVAILVFLNS